MAIINRSVSELSSAARRDNCLEHCGSPSGSARIERVVRCSNPEALERGGGAATSIRTAAMPVLKLYYFPLLTVRGSVAMHCIYQPQRTGNTSVRGALAPRRRRQPRETQ